jgi:hypothetical protein
MLLGFMYSPFSQGVTFAALGDLLNFEVVVEYEMLEDIDACW